MKMPLLALAATEPATAIPSARTITGRICQFGVPSSSQRVTLKPGSLSPRDPLSRVKLLIDHDHSKPVGVLTALDVTGDEAIATFTVPEGAAGDEALASAKAGLRDGLSVGFSVIDGTANPDGGYTINAAELHEVSLVAVPDFAAASVTTVTASATPVGEHMPKPATPTSAPAQDNQPTSAPAQPAPSTSTRTTDSKDVKLSATVEGPFVQSAPAPAEVISRGYTLGAAIEHMSTAINSGSPESIRLALADIVPAQDKANAFLGGNPGWLGELFTATPVERDWIDAFGAVQQLNEIKGTGWRWKTKPKVDKYSGNKTEVPTGTVETEAVSFTAERWAGGWDIDRIFLDLGDPGFLAAFWDAALSLIHI